MLIACLVVKIIQHWLYPSAEPLWPCIKVKVIKTSMGIIICHAYRHVKFEYCLRFDYYYYSTLQICHVWEPVVTFSEGLGHRTEKTLYGPLVRLSSQRTWWALLEIIEVTIFMIKLCMTLNEGQGQYNEHEMHSHVWASSCAKFDDDDFNIFWGIACEGNTHKQTDFGFVYLILKLFQSHIRLWKQKEHVTTHRYRMLQSTSQFRPSQFVHTPISTIC